eukprot:12621501-Ditylum_brightwellii.AAC.1
MSRGRLLPSSDLKQDSLREDNTICTSYTPSLQMQHHPSTSSTYHFSIMELPKSGSSSSAGYRQCSRKKISYRDLQAMQLPRPFPKATH